MTLACILAFDPPRPEVQVSVPLRGMIEIGGTMAVCRLIGTLGQSPEFSVRVFSHLSGRLKEADLSAPVFQVDPENLQIQDLEQSLGTGEENEQVLIMQSDLLLLTLAEIQEVLAAARDFDGLFLQVIPAEKIPGSLEKKAFRLQEGKFSVGRVLVARRKHLFLETLWSSVSMLLQDPLKLVGALGMVNLLKLASGALKIGDVEAVIAEQVKLPVRILPVNSPGFLLNLSRPEDIAYAQRQISG